MFLATLLFMVTAGFTYPAAAQVASPQPEPVVEQAPPPEEPGESPETDVDGVGSQYNSGECRVSSSFPDRILQWCGLIVHYAEKRGLAPDLVAALILQESGGNSTAYSHSGAVGLMQVMPRDGLAASFMCKAGPCFTNRPSIEELQDPEFNISYGTKMLAGLNQKYGDMREALKAYGPMDVGYYYADIVLGLYQRYGGGG
jgi:soluble lytic murein transglycosylase-like protein